MSDTRVFFFSLAGKRGVSAPPAGSLPEVVYRALRQAKPEPAMGDATIANLQAVAIDAACCIAAATELLSIAELDRARSFRMDSDRRTYVFAHALLRLLLSLRLNVPPGELVFSLGPFGKPVLACPGNLHFSLSYRRDAIAVALSASRLGIDLEEIRSDVDFDGIAKTFFTDAERRYLADQPVVQRCQAFFRLWTRKEALVKAAGVGLKDFSQADALADRAELRDESGISFACRLSSTSHYSGHVLALAESICVPLR